MSIIQGLWRQFRNVTDFHICSATAGLGGCVQTDAPRRAAWVRCWRLPVTGRQVTVSLLKSLCPWRRSFTVGVGLGQWCVLSPIFFIFYLYELDRQSQSSQRLCYCWELQDQVFAFCGWFSPVCILSTASL